MGDEDAAELSALRRRAYGPDADLGADSDGLARLAELEDELRGARDADIAGAGDVAAAGDPSAGPFEGARPAASDAQELAAEVAPRPLDPASPPPDTSAVAGTAIDGTVAAPAPARHRRWPARVVVGAGVPLAALVLAGGFAVGFGAGTPSADPTPTPTPSHPIGFDRPQFANSYAWARFVRRWDIESLRVLAQIDTARIWVGTVGAGATTCVAIDDQVTNPVVCAPTADAQRTGIVLEVPSTDARPADTLYTVNPYSDPTVTVQHIVVGEFVPQRDVARAPAR